MEIMNLIKLEELKKERASFYIYFSAPSCNVCKVLEPKLQTMFAQRFPKLKAFHVDTSVQPEIAAQEGLYTNPSVLVFMDGKEVLRKSRAIGLDELSENLRRYYDLLFE